MSNFPVKLSIVVPCYNEEETVLPLYEETLGVMKSHDVDFEMIFVNDGSSDSTLDCLRDIVSRAEIPVRV
ncbi:MAG: glycosyltransferase, partial [Clostridia bacterium]|nr:glycosyltransferase [Clostridia bacterium]